MDVPHAPLIFLFAVQVPEELPPLLPLHVQVQLPPLSVTDELPYVEVHKEAPEGAEVKEVPFADPHTPAPMTVKLILTESEQL